MQTFEEILLVCHKALCIERNENWTSQRITLGSIRQGKQITRDWYHLNSTHLCLTLPNKHLQKSKRLL